MKASVQLGFTDDLWAGWEDGGGRPGEETGPATALWPAGGGA